MTVPSEPHGQDHSELVCLHALQALPPGDARSAEAQLAACAECRHEAATLRPVLQAFAAWPTDVLRPAARLWPRLAERIGGDAGAVAPVPVSPEPPWRDVAPGIACKVLATDGERHRVTMLVRLAPGTDYPPHRHADLEELHMLEGELIVDGETLYPGDYRRGEPGVVDRRVWSETGCTAVLMTSLDDLLL
jgi:hypothetical protein